MKARFVSCVTVAFAIGLISAEATAAETAVVKGNQVNVRAESSLSGQVITQLEKGVTVTVLEEVTVSAPSPGAPDKWARISLPAGTPVWIHTAFIDTNAKTVKADKLHVRAGPDFKYPVLGLLQKGDTVRDVSARGDWMQIEAPANASGFVAADFLDISHVASSDESRAIRPGASHVTPTPTAQQSRPASASASSSKQSFASESTVPRASQEDVPRAREPDTDKSLG